MSPTRPPCAPTSGWASPAGRSTWDTAGGSGRSAGRANPAWFIRCLPDRPKVVKVTTKFVHLLLTVLRPQRNLASLAWPRPGVNHVRERSKPDIGGNTAVTFQRLGLVAGLAISAVALTACGSDNTATTPTTSSSGSSSAAAGECASGALNASGSSAQKPAFNAWIQGYE